MKKKAIIIIPTYNEKENVPIVLEKLADVFSSISDWKMGVLIVDDTSPDKTYELVKKLQKKYSFLELLVNKQKSGLGGAYLKGMDHAFNTLKADVVFEFDADLSHDPLKIPDFLKKIDEGYDFVLGSRYIPGGSIPANWGFNRKFLSVVGNLIINTVFTNFSVRDWTSGYRAITKEVYESVHPHLHSERFSGYTFQIGFLHRTIRNGFKVAEVPFHFVDREYGHSKLGSEYIKNNLLFIFKVRWEEILASRVFKFLVVGGLGTVVQLGSLLLLKALFPTDLNSVLQVLNFISIEFAILSNFVLNNIWTFSDKKIALSNAPRKFIEFNITSAGSIVIQLIIMWLGLNLIGKFVLFTLPVVSIPIDTQIFYAAAGIIIGLFWNFFAYNKFIWKK